jgi:hypothetical protein
MAAKATAFGMSQIKGIVEKQKDHSDKKGEDRAGTVVFEEKVDWRTPCKAEITDCNMESEDPGLFNCLYDSMLPSMLAKGEACATAVEVHTPSAVRGLLSAVCYLLSIVCLPVKKCLLLSAACCLLSLSAVSYLLA